jgi:hypothetical protein
VVKNSQFRNKVPKYSLLVIVEVSFLFLTQIFGGQVDPSGLVLPKL